MGLEKICYLPIATVTLLSSTIITTFWVSWTLKHVTYLPSYISDTGSSPPESCIFGQMLNIVALLTSVLVYIKYRQLREILTRHDFSENLQKLNKFTLWTGYVAAFGMSVVGNFQEANMVGVHFTGAFFTFGSGALYQCLESVISWQIRPVSRKARIIAIKITLSVFSAITFSVFFVGAVIFLNNFEGQDVTKWKPRDGFSEIRYWSAAAEWICAVSTAFYILTFANDLIDVTLSEPIVTVQN